MQESIEKILQELYVLDSGFQKHEAELRALLSDLVRTKPVVVVDQAFAQSLKRKLEAKADLMAAAHTQAPRSFFARFTRLNTGLALVALAAIVSSTVLYQKAYGPLSVQDYVTTANPEQEVVAVGPSAFGKLGMLSAGGSGGGGGNATNLAVGDAATSKIAQGGADMSIMPYRVYTYVYKGEELTDLPAQVAVYRKTKNGFANQANAILSRLRLKAFNLKDFAHPRLDSISLSDDSENGYTAHIDFQNSVLNLYQNYARISTEEKMCSYDPQCLKRMYEGRAMATNDELVRIAQAFLQDQGVPMSSFGAPQVHESWMQTLAQSRSVSPEFMPQDATVVFPRIVDGQEVRDESGLASGVMVSVNVWNRRVTSASELGAFGVEKSEYAGETDAARLIKLAEKGSYRGYPVYEDASAEKVTLELGTPIRGLVRTWQTQPDGVNSSELYVQALLFPVLNASEQDYQPKYIVIPLAKDVLDAEATANPPVQIMPAVDVPAVK